MTTGYYPALCPTEPGLSSISISLYGVLYTILRTLYETPDIATATAQ